MDAAGDMKMMQSSLQNALQAQGKSEDEIAARLKNFHFARDPMSGTDLKPAVYLYSEENQSPSC